MQILLLASSRVSRNLFVIGLLFPNVIFIDGKLSETFVKSSKKIPVSKEDDDKYSNEKKGFAGLGNFRQSGCETGEYYGTCLKHVNCTNREGSPKGPCAMGFGVCCVFTFNSEASTISQNATYFSNAKNNGDARHWSYELSDYIQGVFQVRLQFRVYPNQNQATAEDKTCNETITIEISKQPPLRLCNIIHGEHIFINVRLQPRLSVSVDSNLDQSRQFELLVMQINERLPQWPRDNSNCHHFFRQGESPTWPVRHEFQKHICYEGMLSDTESTTVDFSSGERTVQEVLGCSGQPLRTVTPPGPRVGLASMPGSGNTWFRHVLQKASGFITGATYPDPQLLVNGFPGEAVTDGQALVVKTHLFVKTREDELPLYDKLVLLVRNPTDSALAEYNRYQSGQIQTAVVPAEDFAQESWRKYVTYYVQEWSDFHKDIMRKFHGPIHLVLYENLRHDLIDELDRSLEFLEQPFNSSLSTCVIRESQGNFKRRKRSKEELEQIWSHFSAEEMHGFQSIRNETMTVVEDLLRISQAVKK